MVQREIQPAPVGPLVKLFHMDARGLVAPGFCSMKLAFFASNSGSEPLLRLRFDKPEKAASAEDLRLPEEPPTLFAGVGAALAPPLVAPG